MYSAIRYFSRGHSGNLGSEMPARAVSMALAHIDAATAELTASVAGARITIAATHAVPAFWLMPRLESLRACVPGVDVQVLATDVELDRVRDRFDLAICYGAGRWPGLRAERLGEGRVFPVCSPRYLGGRAPLAPTELLGESLLLLDDERWHWVDWPVWFRRLGVSGPYPQGALHVNSYLLLIQAAVAGHGIALGCKHLTDELIADGRLVRACETSFHTGHAFHVVTPDDRAPHAGVLALRAWMIEAFARS